MSNKRFEDLMEEKGEVKLEIRNLGSTPTESENLLASE
jgi:hypothetical protein